MSKATLISVFIVTASCCFTAEDTNLQAQVIEYDDEYYEQPEFPVWGGPGWYAGVYINNENEYWNHYNNHYNNNNYHNNHENQQDRGSGDRGGDRGRGGGGGHGGGGHR